MAGHGSSVADDKGKHPGRNVAPQHWSASPNKAALTQFSTGAPSPRTGNFSKGHTHDRGNYDAGGSAALVAR